MNIRLFARFFPMIDLIFRDVDKRHVKRTKNIRLIPGIKDRRGGKSSYAEWAHVIGIFQTLIYQSITVKTGNHILDVGCGTGLLGISSEPFIFGGGKYTGIDVSQNDVGFCRNHFKDLNYHFIHLNVANPTYASNQDEGLKPWPIDNDSQDLVLALSVWTHLSEIDAKFYFNEIQRVLKKGSKALITLFYLDEKYEDSVLLRNNETGRFHSTKQRMWIFNKNAYESKDWYSPGWVKNPEDAIGITIKGLDTLQHLSGLKLIQYYPGNWKEIPGIFFQDVLIFEK